MRGVNSWLYSYIRPLCTAIVLLFAWWLISATGLVNPLFLPSINSSAKALAELLLEPDIYLDAIATTYRALMGLILSTLVAVPLGLILGRSPKLYEFIELPTDFFRSIPSSALFFLFILFFGIGDMSKVAIVFYGCSLILLVNAVYGAKPTREKQDRINMLRSFGANQWQVFHMAVLRDALPNIAAGFRVCVSLSLVLVVVTEMFLSATRGLGRRIYDLYLAYNIPEMYAVIIILGLLGFGANKLALLFERRVSYGQTS